jgi:glucokinase
MSRTRNETLILAGDIGGTNTNLALVRYESGQFEILHSRRYSTQKEESLIEPMSRFLAESKKEGLADSIHLCCISAAGPAVNEVIQLTNAPWAIAASDIRERFGLPTVLINDFMAISYAVVLLETEDRTRILQLPHVDGTLSTAEEGMALVVGAGTGLGVGFIEKRPNSLYHAYPSEGGHSEASCFDELSFELVQWMADRIGFEPGIELFVSGQGIANIFSFLCSNAFTASKARSYGYSANDFLSASESSIEIIQRLPLSEIPAAVASARSKDPRCGLAMDLFLSFYARKVSSLCALFLPKGGVYLAGGISSKNESFLMENNRFMSIFERNYAAHIRDFLKNTPVFLVKDYSISLLGAAHAAIQLEGSY